MITNIMWKKLSFSESVQIYMYKNTKQFKSISTVADNLRQRKYTMTMEDIQHVHHCLLCQRRKCISQANQVNLYLINTFSFGCTHIHRVRLRVRRTKEIEVSSLNWRIKRIIRISKHKQFKCESLILTRALIK